MGFPINAFVGLPESTLEVMYQTSITSISTNDTDKPTSVSTGDLSVTYRADASSPTEFEKFRAIRYALQRINPTKWGNDLVKSHTRYVY